VSDDSPIFVDANQPAALEREGKATQCTTLRDAVATWLRLSNDLKKSTSVRGAVTGTIYGPAEIRRLSFGVASQSGQHASLTVRRRLAGCKNNWVRQVVAE
jgi:hypothetical protein